jgi:MarR family transcriptional regulator for hemolysin
MREPLFSEHVGALRRTFRRAICQRVALKSKRSLNHLQALRLVSQAQVSTQAELAQRLLIDAPAASRLVMQLERDGLMKRLPGPDRRCVCLKTTAAAKVEIAVIEEAMQWLDTRIRAELSEKVLKATGQVLARLRLRLS